MDTRFIQISELFSPDKNDHYDIPKYQRSYAWTKHEWDQFLDDLGEPVEHFLGSIVLIETPGGSGEVAKRYEVVDGQQRFTTSSLLYLALYERFEELLEERQKAGVSFLSPEMKLHMAEQQNIRGRLLGKGSERELKLTLSVEDSNRKDYAHLIARHLHGDTNAPAPSRFGNRRLSKAFTRLQKEVGQLGDLEAVTAYLGKLNRCGLVRLTVQSHADAFRLFETINNRGLPLTSVQIIKNKLLGKIAAEKLDEDAAHRQWVQLEKNLEDDQDKERFARHYYNTFERNGGQRAIRSTLIQSYEMLINKNPERLIGELHQKSVIYAALLHPKEQALEWFTPELKDALFLLSVLRATPGYVLLLHLFHRHPDPPFLLGVVEWMLRFFVRRHLTDRPGTKELDPLFVDLVDLFARREAKPPGMGDPEVAGLLQRNMPTDEEVERALNGLIYEENRDLTRFILCHLEETHQTKATEQIGLWEIGKNKKPKWTIEHVLPQNEHLNAEWMRMLAGAALAEEDPAQALRKAQETQQEHLHRLGNLTLTTYNPKLSDRPFAEKSEILKQSREAGILWLNEDMVNQTAWTAKTIQARTSRLVGEAMTLYRLNV
jgi:uncharacterized protein with ParB-like and HNH nuclease domain